MGGGLFQLLYDRTHNVLLTRLSGIYREEDIVLRDRQVATFVARHGLARGLMDFTAVTSVDIPMNVIVRRAHAPPVLPGKTRVIVASNEPSYSLNRVVAAHQYYSRKVEPLLVDSLRDAYRALGSSRFDFLPLYEDEPMRRERQAFAALAEIDTGARKQAERYRTLAAASRQRAAEAEPVAPTMERRRSPFITVSDLFNTVLRHAHLSDADLSIRCPRCRRETTLAGCPILVRRQTTYRCPGCSAPLVQLASDDFERSGEVSGYSLSGFQLQTWAHIKCHGSIFPKSR